MAALAAPLTVMVCTPGATPSTFSPALLPRPVSVSPAFAGWPSSTLVSVPPFSAMLPATLMPSASSAPLATVMRNTSALLALPDTYCAATVPPVSSVTSRPGVPPAVLTVTARS